MSTLHRTLIAFGQSLFDGTVKWPAPDVVFEAAPHDQRTSAAARRSRGTVPAQQVLTDIARLRAPRKTLALPIFVTRGMVHQFVMRRENLCLKI
jgi:hypothetical protein